MSEGDIFREVEADLRREQLARYWEKYGIYVISVALLIVVSVGGYQAWRWWEESRAAADGAAFVQASSLQQSDNPEAAAERFTALASDGADGYPALARLRLAAIHAANDDKDAAVSAYDEVAEQASDPMLRDFARVQAATLRVDDATFAEIEERLSELRNETSPWRHSARELLALSAFRADQPAEARELYQELLADAEAPSSMRQRAQMMLSLIGDSERKTAAAEGEQAPTQ